MLRINFKKRSITARFLLGGFLLCAVLAPGIFVAGLYYLRLTQPKNPEWFWLYEEPARMAEQLIGESVPEDLVQRLSATFSTKDKKWLDVWLVDRTGRVLSSNSKSALPVQPDRYLSLTTPRSEVLWEREKDGETLVARPLLGTGQYWLILRLDYFGSAFQNAIHGAVGVLFLQSAVVSLMALGLVFLYLRYQGRKVRMVLEDLKSGNLEARFSVDKVDEFGTLMLAFNEMADVIAGLVHQVRNAEKKRTELLQFLAHDIRTPLTTLRLIAEEFSEGKNATEKKKVFSKLLLQELAFFERMTEDIFFLAQITEQPQLGSSEFSLEAMVNEESDRATQLAGTRLKISVEMPPGLFIRAQEAMFRRLIRNLISNSAKYARRDIQIVVSSDEKGLQLSIRDDGKGFSKDSLIEFGKRRSLRYRIGAEKDADVSLGLGSVIITEIARHHGGTCIARNWTLSNGQVGGGCVEITFPSEIAKWRHEKSVA